MELQALRYAAMISSMTFDQLVDSYARFRSKGPPDIDGAKSEILDFLRWDTLDEQEFAQDTRIILASPEYSKELTTSVIWLRERDIDITCMRLKLHRMESGQLILDIQQTIPLPEAADFQTKIGFKKQAERKSQSARLEERYRFWRELLEYANTRTNLHAGRKPTTDGWLAGGINRYGFNLTYTVRQTDSQVELWISLGADQASRNKAAFAALKAQKVEIEAGFGDELDWQELPEADGCRIRYVIAEGGHRSPHEEWPKIHERMVDAMVRLDKAMRARVANLTI
jgi:hypothetical protein